VPNQADKPKNNYTLKLGSWYFAPRLKLTIIALLLFFILVYLGIWQLQRAQYKQNIFAKLEAKSKATPKVLNDLQDPTLEQDCFTPITVEGVYLNNYTILIDNQMHDHKAGYRVITPMHVPHSPNWLLVDRGWIAAEPDRAHLPKIELVFGLKQITGIINTIRSGIVLKKDQVADEIKWPVVLQTLDYNLINEHLRHPIYHFVLQLNAKEPGSYAYQKIDYGVSRDKHLGYALEWFLLAFLLMMYYIIVSTKRRL
jgi:surfeit locus 1 family protein